MGPSHAGPSVALVSEAQHVSRSPPSSDYAPLEAGYEFQPFLVPSLDLDNDAHAAAHLQPFPSAPPRLVFVLVPIDAGWHLPVEASLQFRLVAVHAAVRR